jgi:hypothetical protein
LCLVICTSFGPLKKHFKRKHIWCDDTVKAKMHWWLLSLHCNFFSVGNEHTVYFWDKCLNCSSDYVQRYVCLITYVVLDIYIGVINIVVCRVVCVTKWRF